MPEPFQLHGVVHLVRPAGRVATRLAGLRDGIAVASEASLLYHALQPLLRHSGAAEPPPDDFAAWVRGALLDRETAERVSFAIQDRAADGPALRGVLIALLDATVPRGVPECPEDAAFVFLDADAVPVALGEPVTGCVELIERLAVAHPSVLFHHLVEQPWLAPQAPSLTAWVREQGEKRLAQWLATCARSGRPLGEWRRRLAQQWRRRQLAVRIADASARPEDDRVEEGRRVVSGLVRKLRQGGDARDDDTDE